MFDRMVMCLFLVTLFAACGASSDAEQLGDTPQLGTLEQGIIIRPQHGFMRGVFPNDGMQCASHTVGDPNQECVYPETKNVTYRCIGFAGQAQADCEGFLDQRIAHMNSQFSAYGWSFSRVSQNARVALSPMALGGTSLTSIQHYVTASFGEFSDALGEPTPSDPLGEYFTYSHLECFIDRENIRNKFAPGSKVNVVFDQAIAACVGFGAGVGLQTSDMTRPNSLVIDNNQQGATYLSKDLCRVRNFSTANPGTITVSGTCN